jgi:plastocyanin
MASGIRRATVAAAVALAAAALTPATASASGGGGCGQPVSEDRGTTVEIRNYCFGPTILRVPTGEVVTFENMDPFEHSVLGANATWGDYDGFRGGKDRVYRFTEPGVYPYVCTYHVGMVGVVVVGSGAGGAIDTTTEDGPVVTVDPADLELRSASTVPPSSDDVRVWTIVSIAVVLLASTTAIVIRRRRRVRTTVERSVPP